MNALRSLLAVFKIDVDDAALKRADKNISSFVGKLEVAGTALATAFGGGVIARFFADQVQSAAHMQDLSERLDIGAQSIREFAFAASTAGVGLDSAARSLGFLEKAQGQALLGQKASVKAFAEVGVAVKDASGKAKPLEALLGDVADAMAKLPNQAERAAAATKLFGRQGRDLLPILEGGRAKIQALMADARALGDGLGDQYFKDAKAAREESLRLGFAWESIAHRATAALLPVLMTVMEWIEKGERAFLYLTKHSYTLESGLAFLAGAGALKLVRILVTMARTFGILKGTVLGTLRAFAGFAAPIALATALYLIFDDLWTLMAGGRSEIGAILDKFEGAGAAAKFAAELRDTWEDIKSAVSEAGDAIGEFWGWFDKDSEADTNGKQEFFRVLVKVVHGLAEALKDAVTEGRNLLSVIHDLKEGGPGQWIADLIERNPHAEYNENGGGYSEGKGANNRPGNSVIAAPNFSPYPDNFVQTGAPAVGVGHITYPHAAPVIVHQRNHYDTKVTTGPITHPGQVAEATGPALATHQQNATRNALNAQTAP